MTVANPWTPEKLREEAERDVRRPPLIRVGDHVRYRHYDHELGAWGTVMEVDPNRAGPPFRVRFADDWPGDGPRWYWKANLASRGWL